MNAPTRDLKTSFLDGRVIVHAGDCRDVIRSLPDNSVDSVVTDPPYALVSIVKRFGKATAASEDYAQNKSKSAYMSRGFMGKAWDNGDAAFAVEFWAQVLRVLKPGGHVAAFSGTRTYHRLACAIEDAGFEIRDQLAWAYGSGFPKSHDVSKGIDKAAGATRELGDYRSPAHAIKRKPHQERSHEGYHRPWQDDPKAVEATLRTSVPATDAAREWEGWGTALKPAWEPIVLARKPLSEGTVAANVLRWGTGALNIDGCRVATDDQLGGGMVSMGRPKASEGWDRPWMHDVEVTERKKLEAAAKVAIAELNGRWPANLVHDGSAEVLAGFPETQSAGSARSGSNDPRQQNWSGNVGNAPADRSTGDMFRFGDAGGSAARFFYSAKADADDRIGSKHPTVKPVDLMQWLVRLITPKGGLVLDPFAGTGTTGEAAWREGFRAVLVEREAEYQSDIARRMEYVLAGPDARKHAIIKAKGKVGNAGPLFADDLT